MLVRRIFKQYVRRRRYSEFSRHHSTNFIQRFGKMLLFLMALVTVHSLTMMLFEGLNFGDALWLSLTTITTVGYGDLAAKTFAGRVCSTLLIYSVGISLLAQLGAEYMEYRLTIREMKNIGRWKWKNMKDHILIINAPKENTDAYLLELLSEIRQAPGLSELPVQILCENYPLGLPEVIGDYGAVHYSGNGQNNIDLQAVNAHQAAYIIVLVNDPASKISDSLSFDLLSRIQDLACSGFILAEVCIDDNRSRMAKVGANVMVRPMRAYPGLIVRTLIAPGTEAVFENLFSHSDDHMERVDYPFLNLKWSDIVCRFVLAGLGTPMAYVTRNGVDTHPLPDKLCSGIAIITMLNESQSVTPQLLAQCLDSDEPLAKLS